MYIVPQGLERWTASTEAVTALGENENEVSSTQGPQGKKEAAGVEFFQQDFVGTYHCYGKKLLG